MYIYYIYIYKYLTYNVSCEIKMFLGKIPDNIFKKLKMAPEWNVSLWAIIIKFLFLGFSTN